MMTRSHLLHTSDLIIQTFYRDNFAEQSRYINFLEPMLNALDWNGNKRDLIEAIPTHLQSLELDDFNDILRNLGYNHQQYNCHIKDLDEHFLPCIYVDTNGNHYLIISKQGDQIEYYDGIDILTLNIQQAELQGHVHIYLQEDTAENYENNEEAPLLKLILQLVKPYGGSILTISCVVNLLNLGIPLYVMSIYDQVIGAQSYSMALSFLLGISMVLLFSLALQYIRSHFYAFVGVKIDKQLGIMIFKKLMKLPANNIENASISAQLSRIKDFESLKDFFNHTFFVLVFEAPFLIIFVIALFCINLTLALIPIISAILFILIAIALKHLVHRTIQKTAKINSNLHEFLIESLENLRAIKFSAAENIWRKRHCELSASTSIANHDATLVSTTTNAVADILLLLTAMFTVIMGAHLVIQTELTMGALIAAIMLTWRILAPIKHFFIAITRFEQIKTSLMQINNLLAMPNEINSDYHQKPELHLQGRVTFNRVSLAYQKDFNPAVFNINFDIKPGSFVVIAGRNGSGKSTLLKLILRLYHAQAGNIYLDNVDIRQIHPQQLRQAISYVPQTNHFFNGSIKDNLLLTHPYADDNAVIAALKAANLFDEIMELPQKLGTQISEYEHKQFSPSFWQRLSLARAYLKPAQLYLLDEPMSTLDSGGDQALQKKLAQLHQQGKTIIVVTHRIHYLKNADRIIVIDNGQAVLDGTPEAILPQYLTNLID
ncbi:MAG: type I secretion system permease/ATPase [Gammaproteobacteria bacterium]